MRGLRLLVFVIVLAGCMGGARQDPPRVSQPVVLPELEVDHDHRDPASHAQAYGLELVGFIDAKQALGDEPARLSDIQFHENISVVTVNGRGGTSSGGFLVFDVSTPTEPELLARYRSGSEDNWYTKISPDGRFVFLTANGATTPQAALEGLQRSLRDGAAASPARGIQVVNITNPRAPQLISYFPAPVRVVNLATWVGNDRQIYVAASMVNDRLTRGANPAATAELNYVSILRFDPALPRLQEIARWRPGDAASVADAFPHDLTVALHPLHVKELLYVAYWDAGAYIVDVSTPTNPQQAARVPSLGPGDHVHTFKPHPGLIGAHYYAALAPETFAGEPSGTYRLVDITDARKPRVIAAWQVPPGIEANPENLIFSPHEFSLANDRLYASQFHGGVWVLGIPGFQPLATWQTSVGEPGRTDDWAVDVASTAKHARHIWAVDMGSGVLVLREQV